MRKNVARFGHTGKDRFEKEAYRNFLASRGKLDKTEDDPVDINKTSESSFDEEMEKPGKIKQKSSFLKAKDFLTENGVISLLGIMLSVLIIGFISLNREQGVQVTKMESMKNDVEDIKEDNGKTIDLVGSLNGQFELFKVSVSKDLEYIKKALKF